jgi:hypothetical protein
MREGDSHFPQAAAPQGLNTDVEAVVAVLHAGEEAAVARSAAAAGAGSSWARAVGECYRSTSAGNTYFSSSSDVWSCIPRVL